MVRHHIDDRSKLVDLVVEVTGGRQYIVNRIDLVGTTRVSGAVFREKLLFKEQSVFNLLLLEASLENLRVFSPYDHLRFHGGTQH